MLMIARKNGKKFEWMFDDIWNSLLAIWNSPLYHTKCLQARQNRASEIGGSLHTGGSITIHEHAIRMVSVTNKVCFSFFITYINHIVYRRRNWVIHHILMKFSSKLMYERLMENLWMNDLGKHM